VTGFGLLIVRIQSLWLLFDAAYSLTYFVAYLQRGARIASVSGISSTFGLDIFMSAARVILPVAGAIFLITQSELVLTWLVKDMVTNEPGADENNVPAAPGASAGGA
jgi:hypothetical protein